MRWTGLPNFAVGGAKGEILEACFYLCAHLLQEGSWSSMLPMQQCCWAEKESKVGVKMQENLFFGCQADRKLVFLSHKNSTVKEVST